MMYGRCYGGCAADGGGTRTVVLRFSRSELLYDIRNCAWVESELMDEEAVHARHVTAEIGEAGNVDRVDRILDVVHAAVVEMLYPYTRVEPVDGEIDDCMCAKDSYVIRLHVPVSMSDGTLKLLCKLIHEYMVYRVLADWLGMTDVEAAGRWMAKADAVEREILRARNLRGVFVRHVHPW